MGREADGIDEVRKAAREQIKAGADIIKLMATGGIITPGVQPGSTQFSAEELRAGVEEATKAADIMFQQNEQVARRTGVQGFVSGSNFDLVFYRLVTK